ncbi:MAG: hypothetical protein IPK53_10945 [bacterium]|nr:hypothetical protein [bacterium]
MKNWSGRSANRPDQGLALAGARAVSKKPVSKRRKVKKVQTMQVVEVQPDHRLVPYDESLLERARTQWQFGDWDSLTKIERDALQHHPDRAKLALLAAAGNLQTDNAGAAKQFIRLAQDWGCSKRLVSQILVAGVHNSLGRAALVTGQQPRAIKHFEGPSPLAPQAATRACLLRRALMSRAHSSDCHR